MLYQVKVGTFEGPFDLLLHLIAKRELDIYEVSLAQITEEYLATLRQMEEVDLELATEFLVVAATLIEIKASRLLPGPPPDDEEAALLYAERDLLIARLLEYRAFKDASALLAAAIADNAGYLARGAGPEPEFRMVAPDLLARVSPQRLAEIAAGVLRPKPDPIVDVSHITPIRVTVAEAVEEVRAALHERPRITFRELTARCRDRIEVVVRFLAVLELIKQGEVDVVQAQGFGDIEVRRTATAPEKRTIVIDEYEGVPIDLTEAQAQADGDDGRGAA